LALLAPSHGRSCGSIGGVEVRIGRGGADDAAAAAGALAASARVRSLIPAPVHSDTDVRAWFSAHVVPVLELWVAESGDRGLLGILVLDEDWIDQLYVEPARTGHGIGRRLLDLAKRERPNGLRLWTFVSNVRAQRFYESNGFIAIDRRDGSANEEHAPDILYTWLGS
jgi:GNAT superfamily N-acetyltransferase